ncbi:MAG TPA: COX15/CtaA family protein, partial [Clostridia bacterium]|nr:COX15/CtaA family protein [Clostridia bacterium]
TAVNPITSFQIGLQMIHRVAALLIVGGVAWAAWSGRRQFGPKHLISKSTLVWLGIILVQVFLGAATIWSNKAADVATAHVLVGALSLALGGISTIVSFRETTPARASTESSDLAKRPTPSPFGPRPASATGYE